MIDEDTDYVFQTADFSFADANTGDILLNVKVATLPTAGYLLRDGAALTARAAVLPDDIDAGKFTFRPAPNGNGAPYASFTFQVSDGTAESTPANTHQHQRHAGERSTDGRIKVRTGPHE